MRKLTEEQKTQSEARRAAFKEIVKKVAKLSDAEREAIAAKISIVNPDGHVLSLHNNLLIQFQGGTSCTIVGGFKQWLKQGRAVKKGEHGYAILFPRVKKNGDGDDVSLDEVHDDQIYFLTGYVFDVSQTIEVQTN